MSQDSKVLSRAFLGIGLILLVISAIIFYYHFTFTKSAVHTEGIIVDAVWYNNHSNDVDDNGSWYPVRYQPEPGSSYWSGCRLIGGLLTIELGIPGWGGFLFAIVSGSALAAVCGYLYALMLNRLKGSEMSVTTYVGFSIVSLMCIAWLVLPFKSLSFAGH